MQNSTLQNSSLEGYCMTIGYRLSKRLAAHQEELRSIGRSLIALCNRPRFCAVGARILLRRVLNMIGNVPDEDWTEVESSGWFSRSEKRRFPVREQMLQDALKDA